MKFNVAAAHYVGSVRETGPPTKAYSRWLFPAQILSWSFMFENQGPKIFMFFREFDSHNVGTSFRPHRYLFEPLQFSGFFSVNDPQKFSKIPSERYVSSDMDSWLKIILSILSSWSNFVKVGCWGVDEVSSGFENKKIHPAALDSPEPHIFVPTVPMKLKFPERCRLVKFGPDRFRFMVLFTKFIDFSHFQSDYNIG